MKFITKAQEKALQRQYKEGSSMEQDVIVKIFNPYGGGTWYIMNQDPEDPDYLWGMVDLGYGIEMGSISLSDLESVKVPPFMMPLERDQFWTPRKASEVWSEHSRIMADGGMTRIGKNVTISPNESYDRGMYRGIFGDMDFDSIPNPDDPNPLKGGDVKQIEQTSFTEGFAKLLDRRKELESSMYDAISEIEDITPKSAKIYARTKTPFSIINKLIKKRMIDLSNPKRGLTDMVGTMVVVDDNKQLNEVRGKIEGKHVLGEPIEVEDFYQEPQNGYRAIHYILTIDNIPYELQLKTKRQKAITELSHELYKNGTLNGDGMERLTALAFKADNGDKASAKEIDDILKDDNKALSILSTEKSKKFASGGMVSSMSFYVPSRNVKDFKIEGADTRFKGSDIANGIYIKTGSRVADNVRTALSLAKGGSLVDYKYIPNSRIKSIRFKGVDDVALEGSDILNGMYIRKSALTNFTESDELKDWLATTDKYLKRYQDNKTASNRNILGVALTQAYQLEKDTWKNNYSVIIERIIKVNLALPASEKIPLFTSIYSAGTDLIGRILFEPKTKDMQSPYDFIPKLKGVNATLLANKKPTTAQDVVEATSLVVANDSLKPQMEYTFVDAEENIAVATDAHAMLGVSFKTSAKKSYGLDKKGGKVKLERWTENGSEMRFPNYIGVFPDKKDYELLFSSNTEHLEVAAKTVIKACLLGDMRTRQIYLANNQKVMAVNASLLASLISAFRKAGVKDVELLVQKGGQANRAIVFVPKGSDAASFYKNEVFGLLMPMLATNNDDVSSAIYKGKELQIVAMDAYGREYSAPTALSNLK